MSTKNYQKVKAKHAKELNDFEGVFMLSTSQIKEVQSEMIQDGIPCKFFINGQNVNIITGHLAPKGINVINQMVYWHLSKETANKIAKWIKAKVYFC